MINTANFAAPNTALGNSNFGRISSTSGIPWQMQFAAKYCSKQSDRVARTGARNLQRRYVMNARRVVFAAVLLMMAGSGGPLSAHHAFTMFDMDKELTYKGVVVEYMWSNPHVHFTVDIKPWAWGRPGDRRAMGCRIRIHQHHGAPGMGRAPR